MSWALLYDVYKAYKYTCFLLKNPYTINNPGEGYRDMQDRKCMYDVSFTR